MWRIDTMRCKDSFSPKAKSGLPAPSPRVVDRFEERQYYRKKFEQFSKSDAEEAFEALEDVLYAETPNGLGKQGSLPKVTYCTDIETWDPNELTHRGLPVDYPSVFEPEIQENALRNSTSFIPGIHRPYLYESGDVPGAMFALHKEDKGLESANYCIFGSKVWVFIQPASVCLLEQRLGLFLQQSGFSEVIFTKKGTTRGKSWKGKNKHLAEVDPGKITEPSQRCDQWVRHQMLIVSLKFFRMNDIKFDVVIQEAGDIVFTTPGTYHQGYSMGRTLNEAINLAPKDWDVDNYTHRECSDKCPVRNPITADDLRKRPSNLPMKNLPGKLSELYGETNPWTDCREKIGEGSDGEGTQANNVKTKDSMIG